MAQVNYGIDYYIDGGDQSSADVLRVYRSVDGDNWTQFGSDVVGCELGSCVGDIQFQYQFGEGMPQYRSIFIENFPIMNWIKLTLFSDNYDGGVTELEIIDTDAAAGGIQVYTPDQITDEVFNGFSIPRPVFGIPPVLGCTDPNATNYIPDATEDDYSCTYIDYTDVLKINEIHYNPDVASQGSDADWEFFEIVNLTGADVELKGINISFQGTGEEFERNGNAGDDSNWDDGLPIGSVIPANGFIVFANNVATYSGLEHLTAYTGDNQSTANLYEWQVGHNLGNADYIIRIRDAVPVDAGNNTSGNIISEVNYTDLYPWPESADGGGPSLELIGIGLDETDPANWQASMNDGGTPGLTNTVDYSGDVIISEIQYKVPPSGELWGDTYFEFIELYNKSGTIIDISEWRISAVGFDGDNAFPEGAFITSGGTVTVARTPTTYTSGCVPAYDQNCASQHGLDISSLTLWNGTSGNLFGPYGGNLLNTGELVRLRDQYENIISDVNYSDISFNAIVGNGTDSYQTGRSISIIDPSLDETDGSNWQVSYLIGGTLGYWDDVITLYGCTDPAACNFDEFAHIDDGSCDDGPEYCRDCDGNCICEEDCNGYCGEEDDGTFAFVDTCDVCGGENYVDNCGNKDVWNVDQCTLMGCDGICNSGYEVFDNYYLDNDCDGSGGGDVRTECSDVGLLIDPCYVMNNADTNDFCDSDAVSGDYYNDEPNDYGLDDCGVCHYDSAGEVNPSSSSPYFDYYIGTSKDCAGNCPPNPSFGWENGGIDECGDCYDATTYPNEDCWTCHDEVANNYNNSGPPCTDNDADGLPDCCEYDTDCSGVSYSESGYICEEGMPPEPLYFVTAGACGAATPCEAEECILITGPDFADALPDDCYQCICGTYSIENCFTVPNFNDLGCGCNYQADGPTKTLYYYDNDGDGFGSSEFGTQDFCQTFGTYTTFNTCNFNGFTPDTQDCGDPGTCIDDDIPGGWCLSSDDIDDTAYCPTNTIDDCSICCGDGQDNDDCAIGYYRDCNEQCFGEAYNNECGCVEGGTGRPWNWCHGCIDDEACAGDFDCEFGPCTHNDGSCEYFDCAGVCGGTFQIDECGECLDPFDPEFNDCAGCTDEDAINFDDSAEGDDGSCIYGDILILPYSTTGLSVDTYVFKPIGKEGGGWYTESGEEIESYTFVLDRKSQYDQTGPVSSFTVNVDVPGGSDGDVPCLETDPDGGAETIDSFETCGYGKRFSRDGTYFAVISGSFTDNIGIEHEAHLQKEVDIEGIIAIKQSVRLQGDKPYSPRQGINIPYSQYDPSTSNFTSNWFETIDKDKRPSLGCFYYKDMQYFDWKNVANDYRYGNKNFDVYVPNIPTELGNSEHSFTPDVDIRTLRSAVGSKATLFEYYDKKINPVEYDENTAPTGIQLYFYPRNCLNPGEAGDKLSCNRIFENRDTLFWTKDYYVGFINWGDGSNLEYDREPFKIGSDILINHDYEYPGVYEITGYMFSVQNGLAEDPSGDERLYCSHTCRHSETDVVIGYDYATALSGDCWNNPPDSLNDEGCAGVIDVVENDDPLFDFNGQTYCAYLGGTLIETGGSCGVDYVKKFTVRINLNKSIDDEETTFIDFKGLQPVIGGISDYSIYNNSIERELGYLPDITEPLNLKFDFTYDRYSTEYALSQMDETIVGEAISAFTGSVYSASLDDDGNVDYIGVCRGADPDVYFCNENSDCEDAMDVNEEPVDGWVCPNQTGAGYFDTIGDCEDNTLCSEEDGDDRCILLTIEQCIPSIIHNGLYNKGHGELGQYFGDFDIGQLRYFDVGNISMDKMLGFVNDPADESYVLVEGQGSVIITAPHNQRSFRPTEGISSTHSSDLYTGPLAIKLGELTGAHVLYAQYMSDDPNFYHYIGIDHDGNTADSATPVFRGMEGELIPFKRALKEYLEKHPEIKFVLDIHGAGHYRPFAVDLGMIGPDLDGIPGSERNRFTCTAEQEEEGCIGDYGTFNSTCPPECPNCYSPESNHMWLYDLETLASQDPLYTLDDIRDDPITYTPSLVTDFGRGIQSENNPNGEFIVEQILDIFNLNDIGSGGGFHDWPHDNNDDDVYDHYDGEWLDCIGRAEMGCTTDYSEMCNLGIKKPITFNRDFTAGNQATVVRFVTTDAQKKTNFYELDGEPAKFIGQVDAIQFEFNRNHRRFDLNDESTGNPYHVSPESGKRTIKSLVEIIDYVNSFYGFEVSGITEYEDQWVRDVDEYYQNIFSIIKEVTLDYDTVISQLHTGNPGSPRYWNNIIPEDYELINREGIAYERVQVPPYDYYFITVATEFVEGITFQSEYLSGVWNGEPEIYFPLDIIDNTVWLPPGWSILTFSGLPDGGILYETVFESLNGYTWGSDYYTYNAEGTYSLDGTMVENSMLEFKIAIDENSTQQWIPYHSIDESDGDEDNDGNYEEPESVIVREKEIKPYYPVLPKYDRFGRFTNKLTHSEQIPFTSTIGIRLHTDNFPENIFIGIYKDYYSSPDHHGLLIFEVCGVARSCNGDNIADGDTDYMWDIEVPHGNYVFYLSDSANDGFNINIGNCEIYLDGEFLDSWEGYYYNSNGGVSCETPGGSCFYNIEVIPEYLDDEEGDGDGDSEDISVGGEIFYYTPFGSPNRMWNEDDINAPATNINFSNNKYSHHEQLLIDSSFEEIDDGKLIDLSGNLNDGYLINDYKIDFDDDTRKPNKIESVSIPLIDKKDKRKAF